MRKRVVPRNLPVGKLPRVVLPKTKFKAVLEATRWLEATPEALDIGEQILDRVEDYVAAIVGPALPEGWGVLGSQIEDRATMKGGEQSVYGPGVRPGVLAVLLAYDDDDTCSEVHIRVESK